MSDVIQLLPDSVANQIAAGEVIQRPASVIKELVENAVDAGAHNIRIILRDGGKNLIQVIDDGCGMSDTDARLAFERHATSKIRQAADLFELHTMGFRGEALPSIAAVAQIDLRTMRRDAKIGTHLQIAASRFESQEADACPQGTNLAVKNLFFNFPARRKFLKKDSVELNHILHEFERLALVNPDKDFLLVHNDVTLHQLIPGSLKQRITDLFGKNLDKQLIPVSTETSLVKITGFVSHPENARKRNPLQYFFVNGRNMRHPYFHKAVLHCYEELISAECQPNYFLNFEVDASTIDVNIHPTKSEIKFENEAPIWQILVAAIKEALGKFNAVPSIDFSADNTLDIPVFMPSTAPAFDITPSADYNPFAPEATETTAPRSTSSPQHQSTPAQRKPLDDWEKLYADFQTPATGAADMSDAFPTEEASALNASFPVDPYVPSALTEATLDIDDSNLAAGPSMLQLRNRYFVVPSKNGLMIVDRHRAHVKVLYEQFCKTVGTCESQQVLFPESLQLTAAQNALFNEMLNDVRHLGFDLSYLGDNVWAINAVPATIRNLNPTDTLLNMIAEVTDGTADNIPDLHRRVALAMARSAAVQPGQQLSEAEAEGLLSALFSLPDPAYTPTGQPVFFTLDCAEMAKRLS